MFPFPRIILLFVFAVAELSVFAQVSNLRVKKIPAAGTVHLDSLSIVPNTLSVYPYDTSYFSLDVVNAVLHWKKKLPIDSINIVYQCFFFQAEPGCKAI